MKRVLIYHKYPEDLVGRLQAEYKDFNFTVCTDKNLLFDYLSDTEIFITFRCTREMLDNAPLLKWVQIMSAGVDAIPLEEIKRRGIIITNGRGIHKIQMSEYAIAAMIMLARSFQNIFRNQYDGRWDNSYAQGEINGSTVGIIGLGSIGREIARKAAFFGMNVIGVKNKPEAVEYVSHVYGTEQMGEVFKQADYVINLLPATPMTEGIINNSLLSLMKDTSCFINIGRGKTVNEEDLIEILKERKIRAMVSDVFNHEPLPEDSPLWKLDNVILTPHVCGSSPVYEEKAMEIIRKNFDAYIGKADRMVSLVDPDSGY